MLQRRWALLAKWRAAAMDADECDTARHGAAHSLRAPAGRCPRRCSALHGRSGAGVADVPKRSGEAAIGEGSARPSRPSEPPAFAPAMAGTAIISCAATGSGPWRQPCPSRSRLQRALRLCGWLGGAKPLPIPPPRRCRGLTRAGPCAPWRRRMPISSACCPAPPPRLPRPPAGAAAAPPPPRPGCAPPPAPDRRARRARGHRPRSRSPAHPPR